MPRYLPKTSPDIGIQISAMKRAFPTLRYYRKNNLSYWLGELKTSHSNHGIVYRVKIIYRYLKSSKVFVLSPALIENAPHLYSDGSLCLHYPKDGKWKYNSIIAKTIVPWICEWLYFYEVWQEYGIWYGDEKPHGKNKIQD